MTNEIESCSVRRNAILLARIGSLFSRRVFILLQSHIKEFPLRCRGLSTYVNAGHLSSDSVTNGQSIRHASRIRVRWGRANIECNSRVPSCSMFRVVAEMNSLKCIAILPLTFALLLLAQEPPLSER